MIDDVDEYSNFSLPKLRELLSSHQAFDEKNTALIELATSFWCKTIWNPKYHCELNPIEGNFFKKNFYN